MSSIDYGAILKVNDKFINKNLDLFSDMEKMVGFILDEESHINNNYYVYAGDKNLLMCFYKYNCVVISNDKHVCSLRTKFNSETFYLNNVKITISRLDKNYKTYKEKKYKYKYHNGKKLNYVIFSKHAKEHKLDRFIATWEYNGNKYECIYGYGIDNNENIWEDIKNNSYGFSKTEIEIIDKWFYS